MSDEEYKMKKLNLFENIKRQQQIQGLNIANIFQVLCSRVKMFYLVFFTCFILFCDIELKVE